MISRKEIYLSPDSGIRNDFSSGITRKDLYSCRTARVPESEYRALIGGLKRILQETGRNITIRDFGNYNLGGTVFNSPDWYQQQAQTKRDKGFGLQVSAVEIDRLLRLEPFQKQNPHYDLLVVNQDLTTTLNDPENNFIFGYGPHPNNIISVRRFMSWIKDDRLRQDCLALLVAHEFGHNLDLVTRNFNTGIEGYKVGHCNGESGPCLMEQVNVSGARDIREQTKLIVDKDRWLCPDCTQETDLRKKAFNALGIPW